MNIDTKEIIDHIIRLTEHYDTELLEKSLIKTLYDLFIFDKIKFCHADKNNKIFIFDIISIDNNGIKSDYTEDEIELFNEKYSQVLNKPDINDDNFVNGPDGLPVIIYPVYILKKINGFLIIESGEKSLFDNKIITGFIKIYNNYLSLLHENQRDKLTGLLNRKTFDDSILKIIEYKSRKEKSFKPEDSRRKSGKKSSIFLLGLIDLDNFKHINDTYGHSYGDDVLIFISNIMTSTFRSTDLLFRFGGEEFVVIVSLSGRDELFSPFERFRENVEKQEMAENIRITVSIGTIQITVNSDPTTIIGHADQALYYAKKNGKNKVCSYEKLLKEKLIPTEIKYGTIDIFKK